MTFKQRLPYFLVGLIIGVIVVIFVFGKKNTSFDYGPNARVLKNISTKYLFYSDDVLAAVQTGSIDTAQIGAVLRTGKADMWNKIKLDTCTTYAIRGRKDLKHLIVTIKNCDSIAIIEQVTAD